MTRPTSFVFVAVAKVQLAADLNELPPFDKMNYFASRLSDKLKLG